MSSGRMTGKTKGTIRKRRRHCSCTHTETTHREGILAHRHPFPPLKQRRYHRSMHTHVCKKKRKKENKKTTKKNVCMCIRVRVSRYSPSEEHSSVSSRGSTKRRTGVSPLDECGHSIFSQHRNQHRKRPRKKKKDVFVCVARLDALRRWFRFLLNGLLHQAKTSPWSNSRTHRMPDNNRKGPKGEREEPQRAPTMSKSGGRPPPPTAAQHTAFLAPRLHPFSIQKGHTC